MSDAVNNIDFLCVYMNVMTTERDYTSTQVSFQWVFGVVVVVHVVVVAIVVVVVVVVVIERYNNHKYTKGQGRKTM